jgi:serine/threonine protein kinase
MRYVGGQDVRSLLDRVGPLPAPRAVHIVAQVASALDAAHACGLIHRDVKPGNMLLGSAADSSTPDHVYLSDFGISKQSHSTSSLTMTGQLLGTLDYLAPEQIEGREVDGRADLYALACTTFEMLAGTPPFKRDQGMAVMWAQLSAPPPALTSRRPGLPPVIDQVMIKALAKSPASRYQNCAEFASALQRACGLGEAEMAGAGPPGGPDRPAVSGPMGSGRMGSAATAGPRLSPSPAPRRTPPPPPLAPGKRRPRGRLAIAAACLAVLAVAGGVVVALRLPAFLHRGQAASTPSASSAPSTAVQALAADGPASTVQHYYSAISSRNYARAWRLGGDSTGSTYKSFVAGYATTERDNVSVLKVAGHVVEARVTAVQTDGTIKHFVGRYLVEQGVITKFNVRQIG